MIAVTFENVRQARVKDTEELAGEAEEGSLEVGKLVEVLWQYGVHAMVSSVF